MTIPETIRESRLDRRMTQKEVGTACGLTGSAAQVQTAKWEAGERPVPRERLRKLAEVLQIPIDSLIP